MGKNNRARRAATARQRRHEPGPRPTTRELVIEFLGLVVAECGDAEFTRRVGEHVCTLDPAIVRYESERETLRIVAGVWNGGWQPAELARQIARTTNATTARLALVAIAADHSVRSAATLDPRWIGQLDRLDLPRVGAASGWLGEWAQREQAGWPDVVGAAVRLLAALAALGRMPVLIPPPGAQAAPGPYIDLTAKTNDPILNRVRALLAQAESTTFDEEAEAFTAKAQQLMTRHAIDVAMVSAGADHSEQPLTIRIPIDDPYVDAKSMLLHHVAESSRCRSVFHPSYALASVVGFAADIAATEMLFTSLLVQAQTALQGAAAAAPAGAHARSRAFRAAFLVAYAHRIGERLTAVNADVISDMIGGAETETSGSILPVLAARSADVDATVDEMFGSLRRSRMTGGHDAAGWASGRLAADRARLTSGELARSTPP